MKDSSGIYRDFHPSMIPRQAGSGCSQKVDGFKVQFSKDGRLHITSVTMESSPSLLSSSLFEEHDSGAAAPSAPSAPSVPPSSSFAWRSRSLHEFISRRLFGFLDSSGERGDVDTSLGFFSLGAAHLGEPSSTFGELGLVCNGFLNLGGGESSDILIDDCLRTQ